MDFPDELKYTEEHEWLLVEAAVVTVGITDFAQDQLGDVVFVELPEEGDPLEAGKTFGVVESVKAVSDVYSPLNGEVVAVNGVLADEPELLNTSPYEDGWILKLKAADPGDLDSLMDAAEYQEFIESLFRGRYKARLIEDDVYWETVVRYIDLNPVRARMCTVPSAYPFGSARIVDFVVRRSDPMPACAVVSSG